MRRKLSRTVLLMYPRPWRERYGREVRELAEELAATEQIPSWRLTLGLLLSGLTERFRSWRRRYWIAAGSAFVLLAVVGLVSFSSTASRSDHSTLRTNSKYVEIPNVIVLNPAMVKSVKQLTASGPACIVNLNPKTGAVIYAKSVRIHGARCNTLVLGNRSTVVPNS
jgi:hypothetical protein